MRGGRPSATPRLISSNQASGVALKASDRETWGAPVLRPRAPVAGCAARASPLQCHQPSSIFEARRTPMGVVDQWQGRVYSLCMCCNQVTRSRLGPMMIQNVGVNILGGARISILLLAMLVLLVSLRGYSQSPDHSQAQLPSLIVSTRAGDVTRIDGDVWLKRRGESSLLPLRIGKRLSSGDVVVTGAQGHAEWSLNVDSYFQVAAHSQVSIYEDSSDQMHFDIFQGEVFVLIGTFDRGTVLEIDTPYALLTVTK